MQKRWIAACRMRNLAPLLGCTRLWDEFSIASCSAVPDPTSKWRRQDERVIEEDEQGACGHLNKKKASLRKGCKILHLRLDNIEDLWYLWTFVIVNSLADYLPTTAVHNRSHRSHQASLQGVAYVKAKDAVVKSHERGHHLPGFRWILVAEKFDVCKHPTSSINCSRHQIYRFCNRPSAETTEDWSTMTWNIRIRTFQMNEILQERGLTTRRRWWCSLTSVETATPWNIQPTI